MSKKDKLTPEQEKELIMLAAEIEAEAIAMKMDYDKNPSQESGSVVYVNEKSTLLEDEDEELGHQALISSSQILAKKLKNKRRKRMEIKNDRSVMGVSRNNYRFNRWDTWYFTC